MASIPLNFPSGGGGPGSVAAPAPQARSVAAGPPAAAAQAHPTGRAAPPTQHPPQHAASGVGASTPGSPAGASAPASAARPDQRIFHLPHGFSRFSAHLQADAASVAAFSLDRVHAFDWFRARFALGPGAGTGVGPRRPRLFDLRDGSFACPAVKLGLTLLNLGVVCSFTSPAPAAGAEDGAGPAPATHHIDLLIFCGRTADGLTLGPHLDIRTQDEPSGPGDAAEPAYRLALAAGNRVSLILPASVRLDSGTINPLLDLDLMNSLSHSLTNFADRRISTLIGGVRLGDFIAFPQDSPSSSSLLSAVRLSGDWYDQPVSRVVVHSPVVSLDLVPLARLVGCSVPPGTGMAAAAAATALSSMDPAHPINQCHNLPVFVAPSGAQATVLHGVGPLPAAVLRAWAFVCPGLFSLCPGSCLSGLSRASQAWSPPGLISQMLSFLLCEADLSAVCCAQCAQGVVIQYHHAADAGGAPAGDPGDPGPGRSFSVVPIAAIYCQSSVTLSQSISPCSASWFTETPGAGAGPGPGPDPAASPAPGPTATPAGGDPKPRAPAAAAAPPDPAYPFRPFAPSLADYSFYQSQLIHEAFTFKSVDALQSALRRLARLRVGDFARAGGPPPPPAADYPPLRYRRRHATRPEPRPLHSLILQAQQDPALPWPLDPAHRGFHDDDDFDPADGAARALPSYDEALALFLGADAFGRMDTGRSPGASEAGLTEASPAPRSAGDSPPGPGSALSPLPPPSLPAPPPPPPPTPPPAPGNRFSLESYWRSRSSLLERSNSGPLRARVRPATSKADSPAMTTAAMATAGALGATSLPGAPAAGGVPTAAPYQPEFLFPAETPDYLPVRTPRAEKARTRMEAACAGGRPGLSFFPSTLAPYSVSSPGQSPPNSGSALLSPAACPPSVSPQAAAPGAGGPAPGALGPTPEAPAPGLGGASPSCPGDGHGAPSPAARRPSPLPGDGAHPQREPAGRAKFGKITTAQLFAGPESALWRGYSLTGLRSARRPDGAQSTFPFPQHKRIFTSPESRPDAVPIVCSLTEPDHSAVLLQRLRLALTAAFPLRHPDFLGGITRPGYLTLEQDWHFLASPLATVGGPLAMAALAGIFSGGRAPQEAGSPAAGEDRRLAIGQAPVMPVFWPEIECRVTATMASSDLPGTSTKQADNLSSLNAFSRVQLSSRSLPFWEELGLMPIHSHSAKPARIIPAPSAHSLGDYPGCACQYRQLPDGCPLMIGRRPVDSARFNWTAPACISHLACGVNSSTADTLGLPAPGLGAGPAGSHPSGKGPAGSSGPGAAPGAGRFLPQQRVFHSPRVDLRFAFVGGALAGAAQPGPLSAARQQQQQQHLLQRQAPAPFVPVPLGVATAAGLGPAAGVAAPAAGEASPRPAPAGARPSPTGPALSSAHIARASHTMSTAYSNFGFGRLAPHPADAAAALAQAFASLPDFTLPETDQTGAPRRVDMAPPTVFLLSVCESYAVTIAGKRLPDGGLVVVMPFQPSVIMALASKDSQLARQLCQLFYSTASRFLRPFDTLPLFRSLPRSPPSPFLIVGHASQIPAASAPGPASLLRKATPGKRGPARRASPADSGRAGPPPARPPCRQQVFPYGLPGVAGPGSGAGCGCALGPALPVPPAPKSRRTTPDPPPSSPPSPPQPDRWYQDQFNAQLTSAPSSLSVTQREYVLVVTYSLYSNFVFISWSDDRLSIRGSVRLPLLAHDSCGPVIVRLVWAFVSGLLKDRSSKQQTHSGSTHDFWRVVIFSEAGFPPEHLPAWLRCLREADLLCPLIEADCGMAPLMEPLPGSTYSRTSFVDLRQRAHTILSVSLMELSYLDGFQVLPAESVGPLFPGALGAAGPARPAATGLPAPGEPAAGWLTLLDRPFAPSNQSHAAMVSRDGRLRRLHQAAGILCVNAASKTPLVYEVVCVQHAVQMSRPAVDLYQSTVSRRAWSRWSPALPGSTTQAAGDPAPAMSPAPLSGLALALFPGHERLLLELGPDGVPAAHRAALGISPADMPEVVHFCPQTDAARVFQNVLADVADILVGMSVGAAPPAQSLGLVPPSFLPSFRAGFRRREVSDGGGGAGPLPKTAPPAGATLPTAGPGPGVAPASGRSRLRPRPGAPGAAAADSPHVAALPPAPDEPLAEVPSATGAGPAGTPAGSNSVSVCRSLLTRPTMLEDFNPPVAIWPDTHTRHWATPSIPAPARHFSNSLNPHLSAESAHALLASENKIDAHLAQTNLFLDWSIERERAFLLSCFSPLEDPTLPLERTYLAPRRAPGLAASGPSGGELADEEAPGVADARGALAAGASPGPPVPSPLSQLPGPSQSWLGVRIFPL
ncbi:hypothetical protein H696_02138 [Fonticula alba]|uniref:Mediator of RNA polymerase II transcription subunit 13 n=1 Tax=Fonticula alba TaxID=691883 RepID=A0A058ZB77_FONAL|nr:hypothetical protein H696_02138 [Fonticula alba]KCV71186.1 hypothetical protein H696_02138 [Fonticula alba]|eukprot:XP_009494309.1 hypothetical protein H696_02138 [Fonticula alba]